MGPADEAFEELLVLRDSEVRILARAAYVVAYWAGHQVLGPGVVAHCVGPRGHPVDDVQDIEIGSGGGHGIPLPSFVAVVHIFPRLLTDADNRLHLVTQMSPTSARKCSGLKSSPPDETWNSASRGSLSPLEKTETATSINWWLSCCQ